MQLDLAAWLGRARLCSCAAHRQPEQCPHAKPDTRSKQRALLHANHEPDAIANSCADACAHDNSSDRRDSYADAIADSCSDDRRSIFDPDDRRTHAEPEQLSDDRHAVGSGSGAVRAVDCRQRNSRR